MNHSAIKLIYWLSLAVTIIDSGSADDSTAPPVPALNQESKTQPTFHVTQGLDPDGSLVANYQRGLSYAINYFGNYGPYHIYLLGPGDEKGLKEIFRQRAISRVDRRSHISESAQIESFLTRPNTIEEMDAVRTGKATGGLTWSNPENRVYEDVTTNATQRVKDPIENTWGALHEYHHVFQVAQSDSYQDRDSETNFNSWMLEGMATYSSALFMDRLGLANLKEYMLSLRISGANIGRPGINEFLETHPDYQLDNETYWQNGPAPQVYYMLGAWATAYLIHVQQIDERVVLRDWYYDLLRHGKTKAFTDHMKLTPTAFYARFDKFIRQSDEIVMQIFERVPSHAGAEQPTQDN